MTASQIFACRSGFQERKRNLQKNWRKTNYICGILARKQTNYLSPTILFSKTFYEKVLTIKKCMCSACTVYKPIRFPIYRGYKSGRQIAACKLTLNRFASRFIEADKSGLQIAACKLALRLLNSTSDVSRALISSSCLPVEKVASGIRLGSVMR